ncbi:hypothetical protein [Marinomonas mediterranea]|jgi:hypothetical protein|uniref:Uncharacterized protein n=1 Tax=Marinomonas mediterranea (strain ATCC 700492 / JCM 21426 / NBRC 103028 / MMB-1) TaxID=717774 RepID=F2JTT4_MARM1|nr:hypothetical protein [Marinomonas mediterranea]ADZ92704.1 hypothetical protein Marme_3489 [Marinomonas mediterranea MMB-1]WCN10638.1 hypothetical protein GV055_17755 [Marinomonas mediterranea]WCN14695.1 hypothetical protein GV054_17630 [Marinomonas mediterranea]WCN18734.1 hypothetical protein GV053_17655 [Marinomonas mediterranea MMB-1]
MDLKVDVSVDEVKRVFDLLEKLNSLFHQPMKYEDSELVIAFAEANYKEISTLYYNVVWEWLPESVKAEIEDG